MKLRVGINGFGRIGKALFDLLINEAYEDYSVVAINTRSMSAEYIEYLIQHDTVHKSTVYDNVFVQDDILNVNGFEIKIINHDKPEDIPWRDLGVDYVFETTGSFTSYDGAYGHIKSGAKKVIISAPSKDAPMFVYGVNHDTYVPNTEIVSGASCTTNCLAPVLKVLKDNTSINEVYMNTIHAMTGTQKVVDGNSKKSWRGGRAASENIIPESTGAAKAIGSIIPMLNGHVKGKSYRVPVLDGSVVDMTCVFSDKVSLENVINTIKRYANGELGESVLEDVLGYTEDEIVSSDVIGCIYASLFDVKASSQVNDYILNLVSWYDNELGYSAQLIRLLSYMSDIDNKEN